MKIALAIDNLKNRYARYALFSMLEYDVPPDFILHHNSGKYRYSKLYKYATKAIRRYRFSLGKHLFPLIKEKIIKGSEKAGRTFFEEDREKNIEKFLRTASIHKCRDINHPQTISLLKELKPDIVVCFSGILKKEVINTTGIYFLNAHASRLPKYRGINNVEYALWDNEEIFGTIHRISRGIYEGDILYQEPIDLKDVRIRTIQEHKDYCSRKTYEMIGKAIAKYRRKEIDFSVQTERGNSINIYYSMHPLLRELLQKKLTNNIYSFP